MIKLKLITLALALVLSAALMAQAGGQTAAYFSDTKAGAFTGTLGDWSPPYTLALGNSKARHWEIKDVQPPRVLPIAQYDATGAIFLDFGEEVRNNKNASPDVFRMVSTSSTDRAVTFTVSGEMAAFVTAVRLDDDKPATLEALATERVCVEISVPNGAGLRDYTGILTVHVNGWPDDAQLPMVITVRAKHLKIDEPATILPVSPSTPLPTPSATASTDPASGRTPMATPTANTSPEATPTAAPAPAGTPTGP